MPGERRTAILGISAFYHDSAAFLVLAGLARERPAWATALGAIGALLALVAAFAPGRPVPRTLPG